MNKQRQRWLIVVPIALLVWGVLAERVAIVLLAIVAYFWLRHALRSGPIGRLASVPDAAPDDIGDQKSFRPEVTSAGDSCDSNEPAARAAPVEWWSQPQTSRSVGPSTSNGGGQVIDWNVSTPASQGAPAPATRPQQSSYSYSTPSRPALGRTGYS